GALSALARLARTQLAYLKPHGGLYNQACRDAAYARPVVAVAFLGSLSVIGLPGSELAIACGKVAVPFFAEGFADRHYRPDGTLMPRGEPNAIIHDVAD